VGISPFLLTQRDGSVVGSMEIRGRVMDDVSSGSLPYIGLFTFNLVAVDTVTEALNIVQAGGAVESSWSAQLVAIPEPGTWFGMLGAMLVFGSRYAVRKLRR
jgi:hypothetical protein